MATPLPAPPTYAMANPLRAAPPNVGNGNPGYKGSWAVPADGGVETSNPDVRSWRQQIALMYEEELGRTASANEIQSWIADGRSIDQIRTAMKGSEEGQNYSEMQAVNATLYQDPAYAAYMRKMGKDQAALENRRIADTDRMRDMEGIQYGKIDYNEQQALTKDRNAFAGRGMYKSGGRLAQQGRTGAEYGRQRNEYALGQAQKAGDMQAQYSQEFDKLSADRDEFEIDTRQRLFDRDSKAVTP